MKIASAAFVRGVARAAARRPVRRRIRPFLCTAAVALSFSGGVAASDGGAPEDRCRSVPLDPRPRWVSSAAWSGDGELVIADSGAGALLRFDADARRLGTSVQPGRGLLEYNRPADVTWARGRFLIREPHVKLLWLDADLRSSRGLDLSEHRAGEGARVGALFNWKLAEDGALFGFGHLETNGDWWGGLFRLQLEPRLAIQRLRQVELRSLESQIYRLMYPYVATIGDRGYFLTMGAEARILAWEDGESRMLRRLPARLRGIPPLPRIQGADSVPVVLKGLEMAELAAGLYARGERLYVLARRPASAGGTRWTLTEIDPRRETLGHTVVLPTSAAHLVIAPGRERWAVVEKGSVEALGVQDVRSLLLIPAAWIEDPESPLTAGRPASAERPPDCVSSPAP